MRRVSQNPVRHAGHISTHAPLARCDRAGDPADVPTAISTHAPLARCDLMVPATPLIRAISTHAPLARCDNVPVAQIKYPEFQLTHLLRGATKALLGAILRKPISTHAPLARCDDIPLFVFYKHPFISTHAPLARCDTVYWSTLCPSTNFNSRTSCEVRPSPWPAGFSPLYFNSRTSCEVRPNRQHLWRGQNIFQLTHLLRGATFHGCRR